jgi:phospholipid/cholesterol/gamma-HCH transport system permease protein
MQKVLKRPEKMRVFFRQMFFEFDKLGVDSLGIVAIISVFMGAVITLQTAYNVESPFIPKYMIGLASRDVILLEFSSTIVCLILAGKVGSNIASEIGTMRVTEQIDALEIMGVNSAAYLAGPKIAALVCSVPFLVVYSMGVGIIGGWLAGGITGVVPSEDFIYGVLYAFKPFYVFYSLIKSFVFAFIIASVASYWGYYTSGGALEVGRSSTKAVVTSSVLILLFNLLLTNILLT